MRGTLRLASLLTLAAAISCRSLPEEASTGAIAVGDDHFSACNRLLEAGAFEITNIVRFYAGQSPYSVLKRKSGEIVVMAHLLVYTPHPSDEIQRWFLLPDNSCVSLFSPKGSASRISRIELSPRFLPPSEAMRPENLSPAVDPAEGDNGPLDLEEPEKPSGTAYWSAQVRQSVDRLRFDDHSAPEAAATSLTQGMPLRFVSAIMAAHAAEDISGGVSWLSQVSYHRGKYPQTIPCFRLYILPGNTLVVVHAQFNPLAREQFTVEKIQVGEPGLGYGGIAREPKLTQVDRVGLRDLVRHAGPLHFAAQVGNLAEMSELLQQTNVNARDGQGSTALHLAVKRGKTDAIKLLLRSGADVNAADANGNTPLILAATEGLGELLSLLLDHGARAAMVNQQKTSAFLAAVRRGDAAAVTLLLEMHHADPDQADENDFTALHRAASNSNTDMVRVLLKHGANPNVYRSEISPLYEAASAGAVEVVRLLLDAGAKVHPRGKDWRPVDAVAQEGSVEIAKMLIARGVKPDGPALYQAANSGHPGVVKLFVDHGADLKYREDPWGRTALHTARSAGVVKVLVEAGIGLETRTKDGETPLHEAARFAPHEVVVTLLELGADPHAVNEQGKTALDVAADRSSNYPGQAEILKTLREAMKNPRRR